MSIVLSIVTYLLLFIAVFLLLAIIIPIRYSFYGGYNNSPYYFANINMLYFFKISVSYNTNGTFTKLKIFGFTIYTDTSRELFTEKNITSKESKKSADSSLDAGFFKNIFQKDIILHVLYFLKDLLNILKPKVLAVKGRVGFYEPHHTAWLHAVLSVFSGLNIFTKLDIETVWEDEHFECELIIKGHLTVIVIILRLLKFLFSKNTLKVIKIFLAARRKEKKMLENKKYIREVNLNEPN